MSDAFVELTDAPLTATKTAIYLFVKEKIPNKADQKLLLIDRYQWIEDLLKPENSRMKTFRKTQGQQFRNLRKKRNFLRICINDNGDQNAVKDEINSQTDSSISEEKVFIPPNNSFCYQIPCSFKGLHCKKKR